MDIKLKCSLGRDRLELTLTAVKEHMKIIASSTEPQYRLKPVSTINVCGRVRRGPVCGFLVFLSSSRH